MRLPYTCTCKDTALEIENLSNCGDDLETEPLVESMAPASPDHDNASVIATNQETSTRPNQSQQTTAPEVANDDHMLLLVQNGTRSTGSARSEIAEATSSNSASRRERIMLVTEPAGNQTTSMLVSASPVQHTEPENTTRDGEISQTVVNSQEGIQRQERLIEEPPPLYSNLFSASYVHNAANNSRHVPLQANVNCPDEQHNRLPSTVPRHSLCQNHFLSSCYSPPFPHSSHHTSILLPGEIGQHPSHDHTLRQMAVRSLSYTLLCRYNCHLYAPFHSLNIPLFFQCTIVALNKIELIQKTISNCPSFV